MTVTYMKILVVTLNITLQLSVSFVIAVGMKRKTAMRDGWLLWSLGQTRKPHTGNRRKRLWQ